MKVINKGKVVIKCWCNTPESGAIDQALNLSNHPVVFHHIALMPDVHQGMGMPIGGVVALKNAVSCNMVGADIACGMLAWKTNFQKDELDAETLLNLIKNIKRRIPMGNRHQTTDRWRKESEALISKYSQTCTLKNYARNKHIEISHVYTNLGTLGGGNHFLEVLYDEELTVWVIIHSGSRHIGKMIGEDGHKLAVKLNEQWHTQLPHKDLAFLPADSPEGKSYINDMEFCTEFSFQNRVCMMADVELAFNDVVPSKKVEFLEKHNIHHNFASLENHFGQNVWVHRKGATRVREGEIGIVPGSMGTSSYIVVGKKGNEDSFCSCSHGAGRSMSRSAASAKFTEEEFKDSMQGIVSVDVDRDHIDESPMAYKNIDVVMAEEADLIDIVHTLKPMANCKG